jgi:D-glycero-D-manno-heptose 1,7-bisphosphate phosphatase
MPGGTKAVFLDRDGTLIATDVTDGRPFAIGELSHLELLDGVRDGCGLLRCAGYRLILVTNQPDVARGRVARSSVDAINAAVVDELGLDLALTCAHDDGDACSCRKPLPGLMTMGAKAFGIDLDRASWIVGDRWRDIDAGVAAGISTVFIDHGYDEALRAPADWTVHSFAGAVETILREKESSS